MSINCAVDIFFICTFTYSENGWMEWWCEKSNYDEVVDYIKKSNIDFFISDKEGLFVRKSNKKHFSILNKQEVIYSGEQKIICAVFWL